MLSGESVPPKVAIGRSAVDNELLETGVQLGAREARLLFAAQGEADCDLWRFANGEGRLGADLPRI